MFPFWFFGLFAVVARFKLTIRRQLSFKRYEVLKWDNFDTENFQFK